MSATKTGQPHQPFTSHDSCARGSSDTDCDPIDSSRVTAGQASEVPQSTFQPPFQYNASLHALDTASPQAHPTIVSPNSLTPHSAGLRVRTNLLLEEHRGDSSNADSKLKHNQAELQENYIAPRLPVRSSSVRSTLAAARLSEGSLSPASALSSPGVGPLMDLTPLPSPITTIGSPVSWRRSIDGGDRNEDTSEVNSVSTPMGLHLEPIVFARTSPKNCGIPTGILSTAQGVDGPEIQQIKEANAASHARNRSLSEYVPKPVHIPRTRNIVVSGSGVPLVLQPLSPPDLHMHREEYLAVQRGLKLPTSKPPTPPASNRGTDSSDPDSPTLSPSTPKGQLPLRYETRTLREGKLKRWRAIRQLGKGTFSTVMLAIDEDVGSTVLPSLSGVTFGESIDEDHIDRHALVAVKICEQGPAGGVDEAKVETSLKREVEILKSIHHPSLVHLKAFSVIDRRALLVLNYCAGGDLFELASLKLELLVPSLIRRIFAELVAAVHYLHMQYIVHRDIKLESMLHIVSPAVITRLLTLSLRRFGQYPDIQIMHCRRLANLPNPHRNADRPWSRTMDS